MLLYLFLSTVVLLNMLIAMMSNRYMMIMESAEAQWRLQFADLVLLQEATPWWFVWMPNALPWTSDSSRRPKHHVTGKLNIMDRNQEKKEARRCLGVPHARLCHSVARSPHHM